MKKKLLISFLFLSGLCCSAQAQLQPVKNVPSPEIAGLGEYGKVQLAFLRGYRIFPFLSTKSRSVIFHYLYPQVIIRHLSRRTVPQAA